MNNDLREYAKEIIKGGYDLHTHTEPSAFNRALDDFELIREANELEMAGVMIKAHYGCTAARAALVNRTSGGSAKAYGGLVLNWPTGGLNPYSVENTLKMGGVMIWMPTRDSKNCLDYGDMPGDFFSRPGISILDDNEKILPVVYEIMDIVKKYNAYLATGHLNMKESILLCKEGRSRNVNMVLTHPEWVRTKVPGAVQADMASRGVLIEKNWLNIAEHSVSIEELVANMRLAGPERIYLATDRGQKGFETPGEGMLLFIEELLKVGFTEKELITMVRTVPSYIAKRESVG